jgi:hypothetical protein
MIAGGILYQWLADLIVLFHLAFVVFAVAGGLLVLRWRRLLWIHVPAMLWGAGIEFLGWICPLTPLENWLRQRSGAGEYYSDFIAHYVLPVLYPAGLTRNVQIILGFAVIIVNLLIYSWIFKTKRWWVKQRRKTS